MRLINVNTLTLEEFWGDSVPPYAILSHTWGAPEEEITFNEIIGARPVQKIGYRKIRSFCKQAANQGLSWAWCDTCCINKESSAELSESINSMFQWYQRASICLVYLSDVEKSSSLGETMKQFSQSRWFTRGWTLQELLAPDVLEFYTKDWMFLGKREKYLEQICEITGINRGVLLWPWTIQNYSISTRLSWASRRKTTRNEDRAYSMMGILGVHMPLLYGEGKNAFHRLLTELINISADETVFVHSGLNILADGPENYNSKRLAPTPRALDLHAHQITNIGLRIHMAILNDESNDDNCFGILNCHIDTDLDHYIAIPLKRQPNNSAFIRTKGGYKFVPEGLVKQIEASEIFILLKTPQISGITCILQRSHIAHIKHNISVICSSHISWLGEFDQVDIIINPRKESRYEILEYQLDTNEFGRRFIFHALFDLEQNKAGILTGASSIDSSISDQDLFAKWNSIGRPYHVEVDLLGTLTDLDDSISQRFTVSIRPKLKLNKQIWIIALESQSTIQKTS